MEAAMWRKIEYITEGEVEMDTKEERKELCAEKSQWY